MSALIVYQQTVDVPCTQIKTSYQVVDALRGDYYVSRMPVVFTSVEKQMDRWFLLCQEGESSTIRPHQFSRVFLRICNSLSLYTFHYFQTLRTHIPKNTNGAPNIELYPKSSRERV